MDSTPVNWEALDALVIDFARSENLIEDSFSSSPSSSPSASSHLSSSYHSRLIIRQIRKKIEAGDIDAAIDLLRVHAPFILDDHRILFRLQKQKFIELLRKGTTEDRDLAIHCLRTALAPSALDAYPEAYEEFKHILLALIYDKEDQTSPVANEWSERKRFDIAGLMASILRAHLRAYDPVFSMTLRYLTSIHKGFCFRQGMSSPISDLTERLLLEERDLPATPQESMFEAPPFDEVDIQALAHAVELTRQGAIDSLRFAKGDLFQAFQNELCRMKLDISLLDELVREYCIYRGIVDSVLVSPGEAITLSSSHILFISPSLNLFIVPLQAGLKNSTERLKVNHSEHECCTSRNCSLEGDCLTSKLSDGETSMNNSHLDGSLEHDADATSAQGTDTELRYARDSIGNHDDCSTSGSIQASNLRMVQKNRNHGSGEGSKRKRWRGRYDDMGCPDGSFDGCYKHEVGAYLVPSTLIFLKDVEKHATEIEATGREDKYESVLGVKELAVRGMTMEVVEEINALDPNFFMQNPIFLFQLKQVEFLKLVSSGDYSGALRVACTHLGPLAASDPTLLRALKETLLALLRPNEEVLEKGLPLHTLANSLQIAVGRRIGVEEPQLMKIMRTTIHSHNEWFKLQMCKDRFECLLRIDSLKEVSPPLTSAIALKSNSDSCTSGSSQVTTSSGARISEGDNSPAQVSSADHVCDESAILKVMEFLALPRADAIHLLSQYNGNAEAVIQQIFA